MQAAESASRIPARDRLILALDVEGPRAARELVQRLGDTVHFYKLGLELFMAGGYFELVEWLRARDKKVFVDLKFFDVPNTVGSAVARLEGRDISFVTVHGNDAMLRAACAAKTPPLAVLAVTVLTSLDRGDMDDLGFRTEIGDLVLSRARRALEVGCDGVVSSGLEAPALRERFRDRLIVVVPGIRPGDNRPVDDQKRTVDVEEAFERGADYIVVGRPIRNAPDPESAAASIQKRIRRHFGEG